MPTVVQLFALTLKEIGVRFVFGVPSGNMIDYIEALRLQDGIEFILVGHESNAAFMAGVCGRLTGVPGICFGTFGPGATNMSTSVGGAFLDRFPLIAFTDEMPGHLLNRTVQMNIDHQALFAPITKWTDRFNCDNINEIILKAAGISVSEVPGPVHIRVPAGFGLIRADEPERQLYYLRLERQVSREVLSESFEKAKCEFQNAKKPVLVIGYDTVELMYEDWMPRVHLIHFDTVSADIDREEYTDVIDVAGELDEIIDEFLTVPSKVKTGISEYHYALKKAFTSNGPIVIEAVVYGSEYDDLVLKANK